MSYRHPSLRHQPAGPQALIVGSGALAGDRGWNSALLTLLTVDLREDIHFRGHDQFRPSMLRLRSVLV